MSSAVDVDSFRKNILDWYKVNQRALPWRRPYGSSAKINPYHVWLSEIMLQQTTVPTVIPYFEKFLKKWSTVEKLAKAEQDDVLSAWAGLGYYARARNLHKCAQTIAKDYDGVFPSDQNRLKELSGVGDYTSAAIRAIAFGKPANVVDGNIERIIARIYAITEPMPGSKAKLKQQAEYLADDRKDHPGDYAQALMDIGTSICTDSKPKCTQCPVKDYCKASELGIASELPKKIKKAKKPNKFGDVYLVHNKQKDSLLFLKRGEKEMLGGMSGLPTSNWDVDYAAIKNPAYIKDNSLKSKDMLIKHSFTHFNLTLNIKEAKLINGKILPEYDHFWVRYSELDNLGLPTLFQKVLKLTRESL